MDEHTRVGQSSLDLLDYLVSQGVSLSYRHTVLDYQMDISSAIEAGKVHHQWLPDRIVYEASAVSPDTREILEHKGHVLFKVPNIGSLMGILVDEQNKVLSGYADSSSPDGGVAGY